MNVYSPEVWSFGDCPVNDYKKSPIMGRFAVKKKAMHLLATDLDEAKQFLLDQSPGRAVHVLFSAIIRSERPLRWYAISVMGQVVAALGASDMEAARVVMRRFIWNLNDESGGIGWGSPEAMAETMALNAALTNEYLPIYVSYMSDHAGAIPRQGNSYIENTGLQQGLLWGIGRLAITRRQALTKTPAARLAPAFLYSSDPQVRGMAVRALGLLDARDHVAPLRPLLDDSAPVELYDNNTLSRTTVQALARTALGRRDN